MDETLPVVDAQGVRGWLEKKGEKGLVRSFKRRFFRSVDSKLHYHEQPDSPSLGCIELSTVLSVDQSADAKKSMFCIITPGRTYALSANSEASAKAWVEALRGVIKAVKEALRAKFHQSIERLDSGSVSPDADLSGAPAAIALSLDGETQQFKQAIEERDAMIEGLREKLNEMESCHLREMAHLRDQLSQKEQLAAGLSKQAELLAVVSSQQTSADEKATVLFTAIRERDLQIQTLTQASDLQLKRIQKLETQLAAVEPRKTPAHEQVDAVARLAREESLSPAGGGLGSPSMARKTRHRRNSSVGSPVTPVGVHADSVGMTPTTAASSLPVASSAAVADATPGALPKSTLQERRLQMTRRANSMMLPAKEGAATPSAAPLTPLTGEKKLVTPPPWQLKKMMENVEKRNSLPLGSPSGNVSTLPASSANTSSPNVMIGLKSHGAVASLPMAHKPSAAVVSGGAAVAAGLSAVAPAAAVAAGAPVAVVVGTSADSGPNVVVVSSSSVGAESSDPSSFTQSEKELARSLHPLGLPTQGMIRLPHSKTPREGEDSKPGDQGQPHDLVPLPGAMPTSEHSKKHLGGGSDSVSQAPVRRVVSRSADHWAEAAAKARSQQAGKAHESSLPLEAVLPDGEEPEKNRPSADSGEKDGDELAANKRAAAAAAVLSGAQDANLHVTPSFEGLAEKMEELVATPKRIPPINRSSIAVGHTSRFQEQLLEQLRMEQFELLKTIKEMKDESEIQEMRMAQLTDRIRNSEEIIDDKTSECEQQKMIIRELRKESGLLRARLEVSVRSRSTSLSSDAVPSVKRLNFNDIPSDEAKRVSPRDSPKKQFLLSDDDGSDDDPPGRTDVRKMSNEHARALAKMEEDCRKEVVYRQALEKQLTVMQQRFNVEESNLRSKFAAEMEATISDHQREKAQTLSELQSLQKKLAEADAKVVSKVSVAFCVIGVFSFDVFAQTKELQRLRSTTGTDLSPAVARSPHAAELIDAEVELVQKELDQREQELQEFRKRAQHAEMEKDVALSNLEALKSAFTQTDRELKVTCLLCSFHFSFLTQRFLGAAYSVHSVKADNGDIAHLCHFSIVAD